MSGHRFPAPRNTGPDGLRKQAGQKWNIAFVSMGVFIIWLICCTLADNKDKQSALK
jgi:putative component of toxin-antitoxin plasmid stabilization module